MTIIETYINEVIYKGVTKEHKNKLDHYMEWEDHEKKWHEKREGESAEDYKKRKQKFQDAIDNHHAPTKAGKYYDSDKDKYNKMIGKKYNILKHIQEMKNPWKYAHGSDKEDPPKKIPIEDQPKETLDIEVRGGKLG